MYLLQTDRPPHQTAILRVGLRVAGGQRRHVDGVTNRLVAGRVYDVPQRLLGVLDAAPLRVPVPEVHQFLLLAGPQAAHALLVHLDHAEAQVTLVQHDYFVLVGAVVQHVPVNTGSFEMMLNAGCS